MQPLQLHVKPAGTPESLRANVKSALARGLPELSTAQAIMHRHDGHMVLVGSGPSMPGYLDDIKNERAQGRLIFAIKGAHDFLVQNDCPPDYWLCVDPRDRAYLLKEANDHTTYFVSSRCDPSMFDALKDRKVIVVHSWSQEEHSEDFEGRLLLGGGTTSGLRALTLSYVLGFRHIILYGFDSCLDPKDKDTKRFTGEGVGDPQKVIPVFCDGKRFWCNGAMAQQANEFQDYFQIMPDLQVDVKGDGLLAAIMEGRRKQEMECV